MRVSRRTSFSLVCALVVATACSPNFTPDRGEVPRGLESIHARIVECRSDHENGIELVLAGETTLGNDVLHAAAQRMAALAEECVRIDGCDMDLFHRTLGHLYRERVIETTPSGTADRLLTASVALGAGGPRDPAPVDHDVDGDEAIIGAIPEIGRTVALLNGTDMSELITMNAPVKQAMFAWLTWDRPALMDAYDNYRFMRRQVAPIYEHAGLPEALLFAVMAVETGAKVHAYSRAGAAGPLQFMRQTGRRYGLHYVDGFDMRYDPVAATRANVAYLGDQFEAFNDDLDKALAAYNVGETRMRRLDRRLDGPTFWDPRMYEALPAETQDYVPRVLAAAWLFLHPDEYDLQFPRFENDSARVTLVADIGLGELAICLGHADYSKGWYRTLRNLNPRFSGTDRVPAGSTVEMPSRLVPVYARQCVDGAPALVLARDLHDSTE